MYLPFFSQSSTCRAVLQLLAVQGEYANLTDPNVPAPPLLKDPHLSSQSQASLSGTKHSPTPSLSSAQIALNPETSSADQTYTRSAESSLEYVENTVKTESALNIRLSESTSGIPQSGGFLASSAPLASTDELFNMCPDRGPAVESGVASKTADNLSKDRFLSKTVCEEMVADPNPSQTELTHTAPDSSANITSTDPLVSSCPPLAVSLQGPDISFSQRPDITHSQAEETPLPEPQLAVSTGSPCIINYITVSFTQSCMTSPLYQKHIHTQHSRIFFSTTLLRMSL